MTPDYINAISWDKDDPIKTILLKLVNHVEEENGVTNWTLASKEVEEAKQQLLSLLEKAQNEARIEVILRVAEALDNANIPMEVKIPKLYHDDLEHLNIPIVDGVQWVNVHVALKHLRELIESELTSEEKK